MEGGQALPPITVRENDGSASCAPRAPRTPSAPRRGSPRAYGAKTGRRPASVAGRGWETRARLGTSVASRWARRPCQMVGTPAAVVTPSAAISPARLAPSIPAPGSTS